MVQAIVEDGRVSGVRFRDAQGEISEARAGATLIATGGAGQVYRETTNPPVATGDGVALAFLAGARIADMEFVQFHPTALAMPGAQRFLLSEALRGEGARLVNASGERFMSREDPLGDLAPRDRVARAIVREMDRTGAPVYLTLAHLPRQTVLSRFPMIANWCQRVGLDLASDLLPVSPAAHYVMGGVATDCDGRTSLPGLFAAGEAASTGVHGANRLASNSLLEGLVFGGRAAEAMSTSTPGTDSADRLRQSVADPPPIGPPMTPVLPAAEIADLMWRNVGVFRDADRLRRALSVLEPAWIALDEAVRAGHSAAAEAWRASSLLIVARLIARGALRREESRGGHWRSDFPGRDDLHFDKHLIDVRQLTTGNE